MNLDEIEFLRGLGIGEPIESYAKAYAAVATDLVTGQSELMDGFTYTDDVPDGGAMLDPRCDGAASP